MEITTQRPEKEFAIPSVLVATLEIRPITFASLNALIAIMVSLQAIGCAQLSALPLTSESIKHPIEYALSLVITDTGLTITLVCATMLKPCAAIIPMQTLKENIASREPIALPQPMLIHSPWDVNLNVQTAPCSEILPQIYVYIYAPQTLTLILKMDIALKLAVLLVMLTGKTSELASLHVQVVQFHYMVVLSIVASLLMTVGIILLSLPQIPQENAAFALVLCPSEIQLAINVSLTALKLIMEITILIFVSWNAIFLHFSMQIIKLSSAPHSVV